MTRRRHLSLLRSPLRATIFMTVLVAATVPVGMAGANHAERFSHAGTCDFYATGIPVDAGLAQAQIPAEFTVLEAGGKALPFVFVMNCTTSVDGKKSVRSVVSGVAIFVDPVRSPAGCEIYDWEWQESRKSPWSRAMKDVGLPITRVRQSSLKFIEGTYRASVPGRLAPWSSVAVGSTFGQEPASLPVLSVHCHLGPRGLVRSTFDHDFIDAGTALGSVTLGEGELWQALDASSQESNPALTLRFSWEGVTELV
jgi:hypothetical protein